VLRRPVESAQHVPIARIGKFQPVDQRLVALDKAIPDRGIHPKAQLVKLVLLDIRPVPVKRVEHLIEDLARPPGCTKPACAIRISRSRSVFG
jgi:hypothetical protein